MFVFLHARKRVRLNGGTRTGAIRTPPARLPCLATLDLSNQEPVPTDPLSSAHTIYAERTHATHSLPKVDRWPPFRQRGHLGTLSGSRRGVAGGCRTSAETSPNEPRASARENMSIHYPKASFEPAMYGRVAPAASATRTVDGTDPPKGDHAPLGRRETSPDAGPDVHHGRTTLYVHQRTVPSQNSS